YTCFFFTAPSTTETSTLSLHDALPICEVTYRLQIDPETDDKFQENNRVAVTVDVPGRPQVLYIEGEPGKATPLASALERQGFDRSEEHTSELQSLRHLVCRLLLEKKKK